MDGTLKGATRLRFAPCLSPTRYQLLSPLARLWFHCWCRGGKIFHEGANTQNQDYMHSWTPSTTNAATGIFEATGGPQPKYNGTVASPSWYAFPNTDEEMTETMLAQHTVETIANLSSSKLPHPFFLAVGFVSFFYSNTYLPAEMNDPLAREHLWTARVAAAQATCALVRSSSLLGPISERYNQPPSASVQAGRRAKHCHAERHARLEYPTRWGAAKLQVHRPMCRSIPRRSYGRRPPRHYNAVSFR